MTVQLYYKCALKKKRKKERGKTKQNKTIMYFANQRSKVNSGGKAMGVESRSKQKSNSKGS